MPLFSRVSLRCVGVATLLFSTHNRLSVFLVLLLTGVRLIPSIPKAFSRIHYLKHQSRMLKTSNKEGKNSKPNIMRVYRILTVGYKNSYRTFIHSFIHSVFCLTTGPKPPPKRCLHIVRSRASSFKLQYHLLSLRSSSSFLRLLPRLLATSISPFIFPSIT